MEPIITSLMIILTILGIGAAVTDYALKKDLPSKTYHYARSHWGGGVLGKKKKKDEHLPKIHVGYKGKAPLEDKKHKKHSRHERAKSWSGDQQELKQIAEQQQAQVIQEVHVEVKKHSKNCDIL